MVYLLGTLLTALSVYSTNVISYSYTPYLPYPSYNYCYPYYNKVYQYGASYYPPYCYNYTYAYAPCSYKELPECCFKDVCTKGKTVYLVPWYTTEQRNLFTSGNQFLRLLQNELERYGYILKITHDISNLTDVAYIILFDLYCNERTVRLLQDLKKYSYEQRILFLWEPPSVSPINYHPVCHTLFSKIFTWHDDLVDNCTYFKFHYPQATLESLVYSVPFGEKKLCTLIASNKSSPIPGQLYSQRQEIIEFFEHTAPHVFDVYGAGWQEHNYSTYRGPLAGYPLSADFSFEKIKCLQKYKFCIAYENMHAIPGYITEKIFDCFIAGCIPVYWGASNIIHYIPKNCFIDRRDFNSNEQLYQYLIAMSEEDYNAYLHAIKQFLMSPQARIFLNSTVARTCVQTLIHKNGCKITSFEQSMTCQSFFSYKTNDWHILKQLYYQNHFSTKQQAQEPRIPLKIHQIWLGSPIPVQLQELAHTWHIKHPEWEYKLWTDKDLENYNLVNRKLFNSANNYGLKSDIARYEILYREGGVYIDIDCECYMPLDILHYTYETYGCLFPHQTIISNGIIGARAGHPFLKACIEHMSTAIQEDNENEILSKTGPYYLTTHLLNYIRMHPHESIILPASYFFSFPLQLQHAYWQKQLSQKSLQALVRPESFGTHYWANSWMKQSALRK